MANPISNDKREAIIKHMQTGESKVDIARWLFIHVRTVTRVWNKFNATGSYKPNPHNRGRKPLVTKETMDAVVLKIREVPDMTLLELIKEFDLPFSESALSRRLTKLGLTFKKRHSIQTDKNEKM